MEYIPINEGKLKVMLEAQDLARWDIRAEELDYGNPASRFIFDDILHHAKDTFGFDTTGHKVLLQLYPSRDGGCELFITRLPSRTESEPLPTTCTAYSFERLSYLISVCKRLSASGFCGESSAWADGHGRWYLVLSKSDMLCENEVSPINPISFIEEYGDSHSPRSLSLYLNEYAQSICEERAVEELSKI